MDLKKDNLIMNSRRESTRHLSGGDCLRNAVAGVETRFVGKEGIAQGRPQACATEAITLVGSLGPRSHFCAPPCEQDAEAAPRNYCPGGGDLPILVVGMRHLEGERL